MSKRSSCRVTGAHRSQRKARPLAATVATIGGAGMILAAPAVALLANPAQAQAAPTDGIEDLLGCAVTSLTQGDSCLTDLSDARTRNVTDSRMYYDPFLDVAGAIPGLNTFIGNGADGTAAHPDGFNAGLFIGNGGDGYSPTEVGAAGGNGGNGAMFGNGGAGGNGADGDATHAGGSGGAGGAAGSIGNGGIGGIGGDGGTGSDGVNATTTSTPSQVGADSTANGDNGTAAGHGGAGGAGGGTFGFGGDGGAGGTGGTGGTGAVGGDGVTGG